MPLPMNLVRYVRSAMLPLLAVSAFAFATWNVVVAQRPLPRAFPPIAPPSSPFDQTVAAAGIAEPRTENIAIGAEVAGVVVDVAVKVGQQIEPQQLLFRLDDRHLRADLRLKQAMLASSTAQLQRLEQMPRTEELPASAAKVAEARANLTAAEDALQRGRKLLAGRVLTDEEFVTRQQAYDTARQQVARAEADDHLLRAGAWQADLEVTRAAVDQAQAQVDQAQTEVDRLQIRAPVAGEVLQVNVRPGEFVATPASQALIILGDVHKLHLRVDIDEHDIPRFRPGAPAHASVRGTGRQSYALQFVRVEPYVIPKKSLTGDNTERVDTRVLQVIYALQPGPGQVYVGQQFDVFINIGERAANDGPFSSDEPRDLSPLASATSNP